MISPAILSVAGSGVQLAAERWGEQSASTPAVVFLHGAPSEPELRADPDGRSLQSLAPGG